MKITYLQRQIRERDSLTALTCDFLLHFSYSLLSDFIRNRQKINIIL